MTQVKGSSTSTCSGPFFHFPIPLHSIPSKAKTIGYDFYVVPNRLTVPIFLQTTHESVARQGVLLPIQRSVWRCAKKNLLFSPTPSKAASRILKGPRLLTFAFQLVSTFTYYNWRVQISSIIHFSREAGKRKIRFQRD